MSYNFDPELAAGVDLIPSGAMDISKPVEARKAFMQLINMLNSSLDQSGVVIENLEIAGANGAPDIPLRIYTPEGLSEPTAALLQIHGGGFVLGNLDSELGNCLSLCRKLGAVIVSVDYRLAPEHPYPAGLEDCYSALQWAHDNQTFLKVDPTRIAVIGMSAGGGLSAGLALLAKQRGGPAICFQYLGIPELDDRLETHSMRSFVDTPMWNRPNAEVSWDAYLGSAHSRGGNDVPATAAPARASLEDLSGLPPAYVSTMEFDPLRDEGVEYALKLMRAGVATELHSFPGTFHGSSLINQAQVSRREATEQVAVLRRALQLEN
jgi:acetyl esterase/lipase